MRSGRRGLGCNPDIFLNICAWGHSNGSAVMAKHAPAHQTRGRGRASHRRAKNYQLWLEMLLPIMMMCNLLSTKRPCMQTHTRTRTHFLLYILVMLVQSAAGECGFYANERGVEGVAGDEGTRWNKSPLHDNAQSIRSATPLTPFLLLPFSLHLLHLPSPPLLLFERIVQISFLNYLLSPISLIFWHLLFRLLLNFINRNFVKRHSLFLHDGN